MLLKKQVIWQIMSDPRLKRGDPPSSRAHLILKKVQLSPTQLRNPPATTAIPVPPRRRKAHLLVSLWFSKIISSNLEFCGIWSLKVFNVLFNQTQSTCLDGNVYVTVDSQSISSRLRPRKSRMPEKTLPLLPSPPEDSDGESVLSDRSRRSTRSAMSTKSTQSATSVQSVQSTMSIQSRVTVQSTRSLRSGTSAQASKSPQASRSQRPVRSVRNNRSVDQTIQAPRDKAKPYECQLCGKVILKKTFW